MNHDDPLEFPEGVVLRNWVQFTQRIGMKEAEQFALLSFVPSLKKRKPKFTLHTVNRQRRGRAVDIDPSMGAAIRAHVTKLRAAYDAILPPGSDERVDVEKAARAQYGRTRGGKGGRNRKEPPPPPPPPPDEPTAIVEPPAPDPNE